MNMDQLFIALPSDLQWEILSEFVGTHMVRKGKLMRKMVFDARHQMIKYMSRIQILPNRITANYVGPLSFVQLKNGSKITCYRDLQSVDIKYNYTRPSVSYSFHNYGTRRELFTGSTYVYTPQENSVVLTPFEKHDYPSYPYTNKKRKFPLLDR